MTKTYLKSLNKADRKPRLADTSEINLGRSGKHERESKKPNTNQTDVKTHRFFTAITTLFIPYNTKDIYINLYSAAFYLKTVSYITFVVIFYSLYQRIIT
jgi:hypothetical protein